MMLSQDQQAQLTRVMNAATLRAANALSEMIEQRVAMQLLNVSLVDEPALRNFVDHEIGALGAVCGLRFHGSSNGTALLLLPAGHDDLLLSAFMVDETDPAALEEMKRSVITEAGNVILNACVGTVANELNTPVEFLIPELILDPSQDEVFDMALSEFSSSREWLLLTSRMSVGVLAIQIYILMMVSNIFR